MDYYVSAVSLPASMPYFLSLYVDRFIVFFAYRHSKATQPCSIHLDVCILQAERQNAGETFDVSACFGQCIRRDKMIIRLD